MKVTVKEIVEALRHVGCASGLDVRHALANRIEAHGIEQPSGEPVAYPIYDRTALPSIDALIAEAIEKHDDEMAVIRTVNTRKIAQPYLDALIAEIDGLDVPPMVKLKLGFITDKYRGPK